MKEGLLINNHSSTTSTNGTPFVPRMANSLLAGELDNPLHTGSETVGKGKQSPFIAPGPSVVNNPVQRKCAQCEEEEKQSVQRKEVEGKNHSESNQSLLPSGAGETLRSSERNFYEPRFGYDFSKVHIHTDSTAAKSAQSVNALAYTSGNNIVFNKGQYEPATTQGKKLLAHELTHVVQQSKSTGTIQRREAPYIKKVSVNLTPPESATLTWEGTPPPEATGSDSFTVSTGKGYSDVGDDPGTCKRTCCSDPDTQCGPPWNSPGKVGACCTYVGDNFWTGTPETEHNGWKWWTPIQPYYSSRGIALHQYLDEGVTGEAIGHGCVRMNEPNAKRIFDFSNGRKTQVSISGKASPVSCAEDRKCAKPAEKKTGENETAPSETMFAENNVPTEENTVIPGMEGVLT